MSRKYKSPLEELVNTNSEVGELEAFYQFDDSAEQVVAFLPKHSFLLPLLVEAAQEIAKFFPNNQPLLHCFTNPEDKEDEMLFILLGTTEDTSQALHKLNQFEETWWLNEMTWGKGKLSIDINFL